VRLLDNDVELVVDPAVDLLDGAPRAGDPGASVEFGSVIGFFRSLL
jgi:hypothetical protein